MITPINYEDIIKLLRSSIIENSDIDPNKVLNALSVRGTDLSAIIGYTKTYSYSMKDVFLLFELLKDQNATNNFVTKKDDNNMLTVSSYSFHIMIYGNGSDDYSQIIKSIFHQSQVLNNLRDNGVHITNISSGETIHEFVNNTLLLRNDLILNLETVFESENKQAQEYFNRHSDISDFNIIVKNIKNI